MHRAPATAAARPLARLAGLAVLVLLLHLLLAETLLQPQAGWGRGDRPPAPIDVSFVRELIAATPAAGPRASPAQPAREQARLPAVAAQAQAAASRPHADEAATHGQPGPQEAASPALAEAISPAEPSPVAQREALPEAAPGVPDRASLAVPPLVPPTASTPTPEAPTQAFDWPPSTRMNYLLTGHYRGPVHGTAQVDWLRDGPRYQVRMRTAIGPVLSRQIVSDGELTDQGLSPRRFDGEQKVLFSNARRWSLRFGPERITLTDGKEISTLPGAQDEASQFVQLTWLFTTRPERLAVGQTIEMPLIVSRSLDRWIYDVVAEETLQFPFGEVPTFHVKPRRPAQAGDLAAEIWFAPTLQYLPVRILIRQREDSWADLRLERPPLQAAQPRQ